MLEYVKKHPVIVGIIVIGGGFVFYELALSGGGTSTDTSGYSANGLATTVDQGAIQANAQQDANAGAFQLAYLNQQQLGQYAITQLQGAISTTQQSNAIAGQLSLADTNADVTKYSISTQAAVTNHNIDTQKDIAASINATTTALAKISSDTTLGYATIVNDAAVKTAGINANVTTTLGNFQSQVALANIGASQAIALGAQNVQKSSSKNNLLGSIVGGILAIL